jgi:4-hydroxy-3-polyprenylbenzoate decarboxylase
VGFTDFKSYLKNLEKEGELHRTDVEIDPFLELTEVAIRAQREGKPALFIQKPKNSGFPLVINHYASPKRIELSLGRHPEQIGQELISFAEQLFPPTLKKILRHRSMIGRILKSRQKIVRSGISQQCIGDPNLDALPIQTCWPGDGGRFITYGQVVTYHPLNGCRNIGIYRLHVFDQNTTGMHWQIQKGGGFHYYYAEKMGKDFQIAVALGTSPALTFATIAALPEGMDEALFAGFLSGKPVEFIRGKTGSLYVPANAEFVLEGTVPRKERRMEGPFGDHFGHYSAASEFPVFHLKSLTHSKDAVYPATVVGKPPMEDTYLGDATQKMLGPLAKLIHKEVRDLWAYSEAGFHNLLVVAIEQRYQKEAVKAALGLMGTDQLSLTKCIITVSEEVDVKDWHAVLKEIRDNFDPQTDFIMIPKAPLDTLDFTSFKMNLGSKMIIDATRKYQTQHSLHRNREQRAERGYEDWIKFLKTADSRILDIDFSQGTLLLLRVRSGGSDILKKVLNDPRSNGLTMVAAVSEDVDIHSRTSYIWGIFTRFDCERDVFFREQDLLGISPVYKGTMAIDATWKNGYPEPLVMSEEIKKKVDEKWTKIWRR